MADPTILLVDDEPHILDALKRALRNEPFMVLSATSGREGLNILAANEVDIVISDFKMPNMNGVEFLAAVREGYPKTLRVMLTGHADLDMAMNAINHGEVHRFFTKPLEAQSFTKALRDLLQTGGSTG